MKAKIRATRWVAVAVESCASLLLVLILFLFFIMFLHLIFPSGTPLKELVQGTMETGPGRYAGGRQMEAMLSELQKDVRYRRGNSVAWGGASEGMPLYSQDAVQTLDDSAAKMTFNERDNLLLGSNTLVVVTRLNAEDETGPKAYRVQVDGEVRGNLSAARKMQMELSAAGHLARISPGAARFRLSPNGRNSQSLLVYAGQAQLVSRGRVITVPANYGVTLKKGAAVGPAVRLPAAPALGEEAAARYRYRLLPPRVSFSWKAPAGEYHFQLSSDRSFRKCLIDERIPERSRAVPVANDRSTKGSMAVRQFTTGKLSKGRYYWRVSRIDDGREGPFSKVGQCELVQMLDPPKLAVTFPPDGTAAGPYLLNGMMAPGSKVFVDGAEVATTSEGSFQRQLTLKPGVNLIRVEAVDPAGNISYASRIVYGRSAEKEPTAAPGTGKGISGKADVNAP